MIDAAQKWAGWGYYTIAAQHLYRAIELTTTEVVRLHDISNRSRRLPENDELLKTWQSLRKKTGLPERSGIHPGNLGYSDKIILIHLFLKIPERESQRMAIHRALNVRNLSWLAHGTRCVERRDWEEMARILKDYNDQLARYIKLRKMIRNLLFVSISAGIR